jgi:hypothetical protein
VPALILCVPMLDTTFVVIRRMREGRPVFSGGTDHSSHLMAGRGLTPRAIALVNYGAAVAGCVLALALLQISGVAGVAILLGCAILLVAILFGMVREAATVPDGRLTAVPLLARIIRPRIHAAIEPPDIGSGR